MDRFNQSKFSNITLADALAARKDLLKLTKIKVGRVPDRGGRPAEMAVPPPEMPSWQQRSGQAHDSRNFNKNQRGGGHSGRSDGGHGGSYGGGHGGGHGGGGYQGDGRNKNKHRGVQGAGWKRN